MTNSNHSADDTSLFEIVRNPNETQMIVRNPNEACAILQSDIDRVNISANRWLVKFRVFRNLSKA